MKNALLILLVALVTSVSSHSHAVTYSAIATRTGTTCAVEAGSGSSLYCWGSQAYCAAAGACNGNLRIPTLVASGATFSQVAMFNNGTCAIINGGLKCWGRNNYGQLGRVTLPPNNPAQYPYSNNSFVDGLSSGVTRVAGGAYHVCAIATGGVVKCWGHNGHGQLGNGTTTSSGVPVTVPGLSQVVSIAAGDTTTCAVNTAGQTYCWGHYHGNSSPALGTDVLTPTLVSALSSGTTDVVAGDGHFCAIQSGSLLCWGNNSAGQVGNGAGTVGTYMTTPQALSAGSNFVGFAAGGENTCARTGSSAFYCWGRNDRGQVGDGSTTNRPTPVSVATVGANAAYSVGSKNACAYLGGGYYCWGDNSTLQLTDAGGNPQVLPLLISVP